jgi:hypothetical protein
MEYIITERKLIDLIDRFIETNVGELHKLPLEGINARSDDFVLMNPAGNVVFTFSDHHLSVDKDLFFTLMNLFNINNLELEILLKSWFEYHFPKELILRAQISIY